GKRYAHWTDSDVPGRLPAPSWRVRLEKLAPPVPPEALAAYSAHFGGSKEGIVVRAHQPSTREVPVARERCSRSRGAHRGPRMSGASASPRQAEAGLPAAGGLQPEAGGGPGEGWELGVEEDLGVEKMVCPPPQPGPKPP